MAKQEHGNNVHAEIKGNKLTLEIDLTKDFGKSKSGKTVSIASTKGNVRLQTDKGKEVVIGVNCYKYPEG